MSYPLSTLLPRFGEPVLCIRKSFTSPTPQNKLGVDIELSVNYELELSLVGNIFKGPPKKSFLALCSSSGHLNFMDTRAGIACEAQDLDQHILASNCPEQDVIQQGDAGIFDSQKK